MKNPFRKKDLQDIALDHLWMPFTDMAAISKKNPLPIIERGEGSYLWDQSGKRYLDGLSALFCVNAGHGREEIGRAIYEQSRKLDFVSLWSYAHEGAILLAERVADLSPLEHVFWTSGGAESVESALKVSRAYHQRTGHPRKTKWIARNLAYHGTTFGALSATGLPSLRAPFEPLPEEGGHALATNLYRDPRSGEEYARSIEERILFEGPETVAAVILEPVQNSGGCLVPPDNYWPAVREICDRYDVLLIADEVICSWGRLGTYWGSERVGGEPDIITTAKGLTSAYQPMGAMLASDRVADPFLRGDPFLHGFTFAGHPLACAAASANLDIFEREDLPGRVLRNEDLLRQTLEDLRDIPIVGDVRGMGYFQAVELVRNQETRETFSAQECDWLLRDFLSRRLLEEGLICRADDRGDPVVQLAPPLVAGPEEFRFIGQVLRGVLEEASRKLDL